MNKNGALLGWLGFIVTTGAAIITFGQFLIDQKSFQLERTEWESTQNGHPGMERNKVEPAERVESAAIQPLFTDNFSQSTFAEMWRTPAATTKSYAWVENGMMVVSVKPDTAVDQLIYPIIPTMQLVQANRVVRPNRLQFTMAVDTPAHPYRGQLGVKMTCGEIGWAKLLIGDDDNTLKLIYALDDGTSDTVPVGALMTGTFHDIALDWQDGTLSIAIDGTSHAPVRGFDCGTQDSTVQFLAMVEMCGVEEIHGRFDNVSITAQ